MSGAVVARGVCQCGRSFLIFQPEKREMAEKLSKDLAESEIDIFISDQEEAFCSVCGQAISLPIPEALDPERHGMASLLEWIEDLEAGRAKPGNYSKEELDELFGDGK